MRHLKVTYKDIVIGEGMGEKDKYEQEFTGISDDDLWQYIMNAVNDSCNDDVEYRYLGHYIRQEVFKKPAQSGSMGNNEYFFDWVLRIMMEREPIVHDKS